MGGNDNYTTDQVLSARGRLYDGEGIYIYQFFNYRDRDWSYTPGGYPTYPRSMELIKPGNVSDPIVPMAKYIRCSFGYDSTDPNPPTSPFAEWGWKRRFWWGKNIDFSAVIQTSSSPLEYDYTGDFERYQEVEHHENDVGQWAIRTFPWDSSFPGNQTVWDARVITDIDLSTGDMSAPYPEFAAKASGV